jgi:hypothetical protein
LPTDFDIFSPAIEQEAVGEDALRAAAGPADIRKAGQ